MALSSTFTAVGVSASQSVAGGERVTWSGTGTFVATVALEFSDTPGVWFEIDRFKVARGPVDFVAIKGGNFRFRCVAYTSGTVTYALTVATKLIKEYVGPNGIRALGIAEDAISLPSDVQVLVGSGAPTNGTTGATTAGPGSLYVDYANANLYINGNTKASPTWKLVTRAA